MEKLDLRITRETSRGRIVLPFMLFWTRLEEMITEVNGKAVLVDEDGQTMAEYAVVLSMVTILVVAAIAALSGNFAAAISAVANIV